MSGSQECNSNTTKIKGENQTQCTQLSWWFEVYPHQMLVSFSHLLRHSRHNHALIGHEAR